MKAKQGLFVLVLLTLLAVVVPGGAAAEPATSASYKLSQATLGANGYRANSSHYRLDATGGQDSAIGTASSLSYHLQAGFWTSVNVDYGLQLQASGNGQGDMVGSVLDCQADAGVVSGQCQQTEGHGTEVSIVAAPGPDTFFDAWSGCDAVSTTDADDDTCEVILSRHLRPTANFLLEGGVGDIVWIDFNGDGVQDANEEPMANAVVRLSGGRSADRSTITDANGHYFFGELFPGRYRISIDPASLPRGSYATFDPDGTATRWEAVVEVPTGGVFAGADFGVQQQADLSVTVSATNSDATTLVYTVTVRNHGPADASDVVVHAELPSRGELVSSEGCAEDPVGLPYCSLGELLNGESTSFELEFRSFGSGRRLVQLNVDVLGHQTDINMSNNAAPGVGRVTHPIPTLSPWTLAALALALGLFGAVRLRR